MTTPFATIAPDSLVTATGGAASSSTKLDKQNPFGPPPVWAPSQRGKKSLFEATAKLSA